jgi:hypothetical protein
MRRLSGLRVGGAWVVLPRNGPDRCVRSRRGGAEDGLAGLADFGVAPSRLHSELRKRATTLARLLTLSVGLSDSLVQALGGRWPPRKKRGRVHRRGLSPERLAGGSKCALDH